MSNDEFFETLTVSESSAVFSLQSEAEINAPPAFVFDIIKDTSTWQNWNELSPRVDILMNVQDSNQQGPSGITVNGASVVADPNNANAVSLHRFTELKEGAIINVANTVQGSLVSTTDKYLCYNVDVEDRFIGWVYENSMNMFPKAVLEIERIIQVQNLGGERCKFRTVERHRGPKAAYHKLRYAKKLQKGFDGQALGLKKYAEGMYAKNSK